MGARAERSLWSFAGFASPQLPLAALGLPLVVYLPEYYAHDLGLPLAAVGLAFMLVRLLDIGVDPVAGALMDRTRTRWGRFRPWLAASGPVLIAGIWLLFMARPGVGVGYLFVSLLIVYVGFSLGVVSHFSWAATLSSTYDGRSRSYAWVQGMAIVGILVVLAAPALLGLLAGADSATGLHAMGWLAIGLTPVTFAVSFVSASEPVDLPSPIHARLGDYIALFRNGSFVRLLITDQFLQLSAQVTGALFFFFFLQVKHFTKAEAGLLMLAYFLGGLGGGAIWSRLGSKLGKHNALAIGAVILTVTQTAALLMPARNLALGAVLILVAGLPYSASAILVRSMLADVADEQRLATGDDRTGLFYALLVGGSKIAAALAVGVTYPLLQFIGFRATDGAVNSPSALIGLAVVFAVAPGVLALAGAAAVRGYRLTAERQAEIRIALERRDVVALASEPNMTAGRASPPDPLGDARPAE